MPAPRADSELYRIRDRLGLTQEDFAHQIGVSTATVQAIENDRRKLSQSVINKITAAFPDMKEATTDLTEVNFETDAMAKVYLALRPLSAESRERVLRWVFDRLGSEVKGLK